MASTGVEIKASFRDEFGKGASRRYRREGLVPAVMYGTGSELRHVTLPAHELGLALRIPQVVLNVDLDGKHLLVAPRDVQRDPVRTDLHHVDLILLSDAEVKEREIYAQALARAEELAAEAELDPVLAANFISDAAEEDKDLLEVAENIVQLLEEQAEAMREAAAAEAAREEEAAAAAAAADATGDEDAGEEAAGDDAGSDDE